MKRLLLIIILFTISIFSQTMPDAEPGYITGKQYADFSFGSWFGFGSGAGTGTGTTYYVLLPSSTDRMLLPSSTDKVKLPGH
jgi:hypothetical protein